MHMPVVDTRPVIGTEWTTEDAEKVISLLAIYAETNDVEERTTYYEWLTQELARRGSLVRLMIGLVGLQEYSRIRGYETE